MSGGRKEAIEDRGKTHRPRSESSLLILLRAMLGDDDLGT